MGVMRRRFHHGLFFNAAVVSLVAAAPASAQTRVFDLPAQDASVGIPTFAKQAGIQLLANAKDLRGKRTNAVHGHLDAQDALKLLLKGTGLEAVSNPATGIFMVRRQQLGNANAGEAESAEEIRVTGTRIRGAAVASPTIRITREQIAEQGHTDLGQVIRSLPQNYNGGQNPSILLGSGQVSNQNATSGSALNLRGLGPDATLTLLDGNRLSYGGFAQSIDISAIPLGAVERLDIVTDGASALYGSDAVAGVANIVTRRNFRGLELSGRLGGATDGGLFSRDVSATAGTTWAGGQALIAYEYENVDPLYSQKRDYLSYMPAGNIVYPPIRRHSAFAQASQSISDSVVFSIEGLFLDRRSLQSAITTGLTLNATTRSRIFSVAPRLDVALSADWAFALAATYGQDHTYSVQNTQLFGSAIYDAASCYCNSSWSVEGNFEGRLFSLPAGDVRIAAGGGYRRNRYDETIDNRLSASSSETAGDQSSKYGFAEASIPLVSPVMDIAGIHRLSATAAARHESYRQFGSVTTPKLGLIYEPLSGVSLKGSWGRSFKAPTLNQQLSSLSLLLGRASSYGATGYPASAALLVVNGSNGNLRPERARTWSTTLTLEPDFTPGLKVEATYFDVDYTDRLVQPLDGVSGALFTNPVYARFLARNPTLDQQAALVAAAGGIGLNSSGFPYDPANVVGIAYNNYTNIAREHADGVDLSASYRMDLFGGSATLDGAASWLHLTSLTAPGEAQIKLSGFVFNPPKFRARGGIAWSKGGASVAVNENYIGKLIDDQEATVGTLGSFKTTDLTARYRVPAGGRLWSGVELGLILSNLFNEKPALRVPLANYVVNFDSTNHNAIGRVISGTITKRW